MRRLSSKLVLATALSAAFFIPAVTPAMAANARQQDNPDISSILPEEKPDEPVLMLVSLDDQSIQVYAGDNLIARSNVSTGKPGHRTPTGIFSILEKRRHHHSNIYSRAPMPFMQRLTWSGIALHESKSVPDYPASHGCVRLPHVFAKQLFGFTGIGAHVLVTHEELTPAPIQHRNLFYPDRGSNGSPMQSSSLVPDSKTKGLSPVRVAESFSIERIASNNDALSFVDGYVLRSSIDAIAPAPIEADDFVVPQSRSPIRVLITRRTGRDLMRDVQALLNQLGFDAGDEDGWMGPDTGNAIVRYQKSRALEPTGTVSMALARQLHADAGRGKFPTGHIYVRQNFKPLFDAPVVLNESETPLGTHFMAALSQPTNPDGLRWVYTSPADRPTSSPLLEISGDAPYSTAQVALDRIDVPQHIRKRLSATIVPGSSLIITDSGVADESHLGTDFIVLTKSFASD